MGETLRESESDSIAPETRACRKREQNVSFHLEPAKHTGIKIGIDIAVMWVHAWTSASSSLRLEVSLFFSSNCFCKDATCSSLLARIVFNPATSRAPDYKICEVRIHKQKQLDCDSKTNTCCVVEPSLLHHKPHLLAFLQARYVADRWTTANIEKCQAGQKRVWLIQEHQIASITEESTATAKSICRSRPKYRHHGSWVSSWTQVVLQ